jgi:uncharacterized membrane protein
MSSSKSEGRIFFVWFRNKFITGLFVAIPLVITYWILNFLYRAVSSVTDPFVKTFVSYNRASLPDFLIIEDVRGIETIPGAALVITLLLIFLIGLLTANVIGKRILGYFDSLLHRIPLVNAIYPVAKQVVESLRSLGGSEEDLANKKVVYVPYPGIQGYLLGFQTGRFCGPQGKTLASVFIPTAPNPVTGFVLVFGENQLIDSGLSMEDAWKLVVSGGLLTPLPLEIPAPLNFPAATIPPTPAQVPAGTTQRA